MATRFNTGNPIDSNDPRDGSDNMANLDQMVNSAGQTFTDRFGASRKTLTGYDTEIQSRVDNAVASWVQPDNTGDWVTGTAYTEGQLWKEAGEYYFVLADYTSGASAAADIAAGHVAEYTNTARQRVKTSIADLEASTPFYDGEAIYLSAGGRSGTFIWDSSDLSTEVAADTLQGVYIAPSSDTTGASGAWKRKLEGSLYIEMFGAIGNDSTVNTSAIQSAVDTAEILGHGEVHHGPGTFVTGQIQLPPENMIIVGPAKPLNQQQSNQSFIKAASKGLDLFVIKGTPPVAANIGFKNTNLRGFDDTDTEARLFYNNGTTIVYGLTLDNVGFSDCAFGWFIPNSFADKTRHTHGWNCHTAIGFSSDAVSCVYENPRVGKCPSGAISSITGITRANPAVVTAPSHGLSNGHIVWLQDVVGMTEVNNRIFIVDNATTNTFQLKGVDGSGFSAYSSGGECNRTSVGYWFRGPNCQVINADTAAETSGRGTFMFVVGESTRLNLTGSTTTAHAHFDTAHLEGTDGGFINVATGSNATGNDCHFITSAIPLPRAIFFDFLNDITTWNSCQFTTKSGGSYTTEIEVYSRDSSTSKVIITPYSLSDLPSVSVTGSLLSAVYYNCGSYGFRAKRSAVQTIPPSTETQIVLNSELFDTNNVNNTTTGEITVALPGIYILSGSVFFGSSVDGAVYEVRLKVDGAEEERIRIIAADTDGLSVPLSFSPLGLAGGEVITIHAFQNSGASADISSGFKTTVGLSKL